MSERLPYEEQLSQQWNELPLPDENMAWTDMKRRLEEEEDKPLLPFWLGGCVGWGLLGILLLGLAWWIVRPEKWFYKHKKEEKQSTVVEERILTQEDTAFSVTNTDSTQAEKANSIKKDSGAARYESVQVLPLKKQDKVTTSTTSPVSVSHSAAKKERNVKGSEPLGINKAAKTENEVKNKQQPVAQAQNGDRNPVKTDSIEVAGKVAKKDTTSSSTEAKTMAKTDSLQQVRKDSTATKQKTATEEQVKKTKPDSSSKKSLIFNTGIGLQQQLPISGQQFIPYNSLGRKGTLADYIPSVYIRLTKPDKWFLQSEFRYGAPQQTKEFIYQQKIVSDTGTNPQFSRISSATLKKTYYHQLPLTFNYYVLPNLSVGAGIQLNRFVSAVTEKELVRRNNFLQQDSLLSKVVSAIKGDSASEFKKTYLQAVFESQFQWKRFSFGARYTFGLQPYITFTLPGGVPQQERNHSLQLFIRYELWKSKTKR